jgi:transglutaminase-like putative cysteine protease
VEDLTGIEAWLHARCTLSFEVSVATPMVFMLRPRSSPSQWVAAEEYDLSPSLPVVEFTDGFGNLCQRVVAPVGDFQVHTQVTVRVKGEPTTASTAGFVDVSKLPHDTLGFLLPSRYCESDRFGEMATEIVAGHPPGYAQVVAITDWIRSSICNTPLSSTYPVSAVEVNQRGEGVCRDLAHIGIALCRAICIPARMVVGYLLGLEPMDTHAWFEAFIGGRWHTFDPTQPGTGGVRIAIARGRDAADVALYNQYGPLLLPNEMSVTVSQLERPESG